LKADPCIPIKGQAVNTFYPCRHVSKIANHLGGWRTWTWPSVFEWWPPVMAAWSWGVTTHHSGVVVEDFNVLKRYEHEQTLLSRGNR